jgi:MOSC domain-containing protein YiiM
LDRGCRFDDVEVLVGKLERIWVKRAHRGPMDAVSTGELEAGRGLVGNANYGGRRQVTVIAAERWADIVERLGADVDPMARRANLLVSGIELANSRDRVLRVGTCRLRIGGETRPCERMDEAHPGLQAVMRADWGGGAWAQVETGGTLHVGDEVEWESPNHR